MGDETRQHTGAERQQIRRHECVQRRDNVHYGSPNQLRTRRQAGHYVHHAVDIYYFLQHSHLVPRLRAKGVDFIVSQTTVVTYIGPDL